MAVSEKDCVRYENGVAVAVQMLGRWYDVPNPRGKLSDFNDVRIEVLLTSTKRRAEMLSLYVEGTTVEAFLNGKRDQPGVYSGVGVNCTGGTIIPLGMILPIQFNGPTEEPAVMWDHIATETVLQHRAFVEAIEKAKADAAAERKQEMLDAAAERFK